MGVVVRSLLKGEVSRREYLIKLILFHVGRFRKLRDSINFYLTLFRLAEASSTDSTKPTLDR
jgi:hypothetical protein